MMKYTRIKVWKKVPRIFPFFSPIFYLLLSSFSLFTDLHRHAIYDEAECIKYVQFPFFFMLNSCALIQFLESNTATTPNQEKIKKNIENVLHIIKISRFGLISVPTFFVCA